MLASSPHSAAPSSDNVQRLIQRCAKPSTAFSSNELGFVAKLCEVVKLFLGMSVSRLVLARCDEPLLFFYSADSTPVATKELYQQSLVGQTVKRKGRSLVELLVQRMFVLAGDGTVAVLLDEPRPMADKTAWTHTQAYRDLFDWPRGLGHRSILVFHYVWDRAVHSAALRQIRLLHKAAEEDDYLSEHMPPGLAPLLSWVASSACCSHDAHNALK